MSRTAKVLDFFVQFLIIYSITTYLIEVEYFRTQNSLVGHPFFLWSERVVAVIFTIEYCYYCLKDRRHPTTIMGVVDLLAIIPFWIGFFVSAPYLYTIRTLRILRLLKFFRHNQTLKHLCEALGEARQQLWTITSLVFMIALFSSALIHEAERIAQPETFGSIGNSLWWVFVTLTTVGYGDAYPKTLVGKLIAVVIMLFGVGVMGAYLGIVGNACSTALNKCKRKRDEREVSKDSPPSL